MTRLINPGEGDRFDRITILLLKLGERHHGPKVRAEWQAELDALSTGLPALSGVKVAQINARVWEREDEIRFLAQLEEADPRDRHSLIQARIAILAVGTRRLNDDKHEILVGLNGYIEKV